MNSKKLLLWNAHRTESYLQYRRIPCIIMRIVNNAILIINKSNCLQAFAKCATRITIIIMQRPSLIEIYLQNPSHFLVLQCAIINNRIMFEQEKMSFLYLPISTTKLAT